MDIVQFVMADGTVKSGGYATTGGDANPSFGLDPVFDLSPDEHILKIEVFQQDRLAGLRIVSTKGRVSPWYGTQRGERKTFVASANNPIVSIEREVGQISSRIVRAQRLDGSALEPSSDREKKARAPGAPVRTALTPCAIPCAHCPHARLLGRGAASAVMRAAPLTRRAAGRRCRRTCV